MTVAGTYIVGIFPPSPKLMRTGMDLMKGRIDEPRKPEVRAEAIRQYVRELADFQRRIGVAFYSDGNIRFPDIFRPVAELIYGVELPEEGMAGMSAFSGRNYYYQKPHIVHAITPGQTHQIDHHFSWDDFPAPRKATLPGPFTFLRASQNDAYANDAGGIRDLSLIISLMASDAAKNAEVVELDESLLAYEFPRTDNEILYVEKAALERIKAALPEGRKLALYIGYNPNSVQHLASRLPADIYEINALATGPDKIHIPSGDVALGIADALSPARDLVESPKVLSERARRILEKNPQLTANGRKVYLVPNAPFDTSFAIATQKMQALAEAARLVS